MASEDRTMIYIETKAMKLAEFIGIGWGYIDASGTHFMVDISNYKKNCTLYAPCIYCGKKVEVWYQPSRTHIRW